MRKIFAYSLLLFFICGCGPHSDPHAQLRANSDVAKLKIAAFNARALGSRKISDRKVLNNLTKIFASFDMVFIQELRDLPEQSLEILADRVSAATNHDYDYALSGPLGGEDSIYFEHYAYFFRKDLFIDHSERDFKKLCSPFCSKFLRPPYIVNFTTKNLHTITFFGVHLQPSEAKVELEALGKLADKIEEKWQHSQTLVLGDMNASCRYVSRKQLNLIREDNYLDFTWRIQDDQDTTLASSQCAYDRIISKGRPYDQVIPGSEGVFNFDSELKLNQEDAAAVSDHYPVYVDVEF